MTKPLSSAGLGVEPQVDIPVIGIGASTGGLQAITEFLSGVEGPTGMAYVLVQHLAPAEKSWLPKIISDKTRMVVRQISDGDRIEPDHFYTLPARHDLTIREGRLRLLPVPENTSIRRPIDAFLTNLAEAQRDFSASVILSGAGTDGSSGLRAVKDFGGLCLAQVPETARHESMPSAAIASGYVDFVLSAEDMVGKLCTFFKRRHTPEAIEEAKHVAERIDDLCDVLNDSVGHDFSGYKQSTMVRRIERRMQVVNKPSAGDYIDFLKESDDECEVLFQDLLINVTGFFRDGRYFDILARKVIEPLVEKATLQDEIRVWVPACSSGQEAYTIAMLIDDALRGRARRPLVQVFATDIDQQMIAVAREGRYSEGALLELPQRFRDRYAVALDGQFQISPKIRDMVRFSVHSIIKDPPFSRLDLISCRNLLIYLNDQIQESVIPLLHYSLAPGGHLFLGPSESLSRREDLFKAVDQKARIFQRKETAVAFPVELPLGVDLRQRTLRDYAAPPRENTPIMQNDATNRLIMERYAPPFVRVTPDGDIRSSFGELSQYLRSVHGNVPQTLGELARPGLREAVMPLVREASEAGERRVLKEIEITSPYGVQTVDLVADPAPDGTVALIFVAVAPFRQRFSEHYTEPASPGERMKELEDELRVTRHRLRHTSEELGAANEELKSSNEEMMSMNEELQSANEELSTVNEELKNKVDELGVANADLANFLRSTRMPMVVVDKDMRIRMFTEQARMVFPFQDTDRGRTLSEFSLLVDDGHLIRDVMNAIRKDEPVERPVQTKIGSGTYQMRVMPYQSAEGAVEGATLTFNDISQMKLLEDDLRIKTERLGLALDAGRMGVWEYDIENDVNQIDDRVAEFFGIEDTHRPGVEPMLKRVHEEDVERVRRDFAYVIETGRPYAHVYRINAPDGSIRWMRSHAQRFATAEGTLRVFGILYDVTEEQEFKDKQALLLREMNHRVKNLFAVVSSLIGVTSRNAVDVPAFAKTLRSRIDALARAYEITQDHRSATDVDFRALIESVLAPFDFEKKFTLQGPDVAIPVEAVTPIGLIAHEFATNAMKYGALADGTGRVELKWEQQKDRVLTFDWNETGSTYVPLTQSDHGFGTRLIDTSVRQLRGSIERDWEPDGLRARITLRIPEALSHAG